MFSIVLALVAVVSAQGNLNWKGWDTSTVTSFKTTALFISKCMNFTNAEDKMLVFVYDDTMNSARATDSVAAEVGYMLGSPIANLSGALDTAWSTAIIIDTINSQTASKRYDPVKYGGSAAWGIDGNGFSTRAHGQIDTTIGTTSSAVFMPFNPIWSPFCKFYLKGLTGNAGTFIRAKLIFIQRGWVNVRNQ
jgi:hypothetical protein